MQRSIQWLTGRTAWLLIAAAALAGAALTVNAGCCGSLAPSSSPGETAVDLCTALGQTSPPSFADPPAPSPPSSRVTVGVSVTTARLRRELSAQVPVELARESGRSIGAPGRVTYVVRRGDFGFELVDHRLVVSTGVKVHVEVCKPLGPFCPTYGSCDPELSSTASLPMTLAADYRIGRSQVDVRVTRPCVIAGFDATPEIRKIADREARQAQRTIDASLPPVRPHVLEAYQRLQRPIQLDHGGCLRITPTRVSQAQPKLVEARLSTRLMATGTVELDPDCSGAPPSPDEPTLPSPELVTDVPDSSELRVALSRSWGEVARDLRESLAAVDAPAELGAEVELEVVEARGAQVEGRPMMAIALRFGPHPCGTLWLTLQPRYDASTRRIHWHDARPAVEGLAADAWQRAVQIAAHVERHASVAPPAAASEAASQLRRVAQQLAEVRRDGAELSIEIDPPRMEPVICAPHGLVSVVLLSGRAAISVE